MQEHAAAGQHPTYQELAKLLKCRPQNFSEWAREPAWTAAVIACYRSTSGVELARGELAVMQRIKRGDTRAYFDALDRGAPAFWAPDGVAGMGAAGGPGGFQNTGPRVEVHVHGIPERAPLSSGPPLLTLPAAPATPGGSK